MLFQSAVPVNDTSCNFGTAAAPAAGSNIINKTAPAAGAYKLTLTYVITGAQETAAGNIAIKANGATLAQLPTAYTFAGVAPPPFVVEKITLDGLNNVQVQAVANAVASTVYSCTLTLTRIG